MFNELLLLYNPRLINKQCITIAYTAKKGSATTINNATFLVLKTNPIINQSFTLAINLRILP